MVNILYIISTALGGHVAILEDMIVDKEYRGQGIGRSLVEFTLAQLKVKKIQRVTLLSDTTNTKAHNFYEQQGFIHSTMTPFRKIL